MRARRAGVVGVMWLAWCMGHMALAATLRVPGDYGTLQEALGAAEAGDEIWVAAGTWRPTFGSDRSASFVIPAGVAVYGGFVGGEASRDERDWERNRTILSGEIGSGATNEDNSRHVVIGGEGARLDGLTIADGYAEESSGAGVLMTGVTMTIAHCRIEGNELLSVQGGGLAIVESRVDVMDCEISRNEVNGGSGGGLSVSGGSTVTLTRCVFEDNRASGGRFGSSLGGAVNSGGEVLAIDCVFTGNRADLGGAVGSFGGNGVFINCSFFGNQAIATFPSFHGNGGGVASLQAESLTLRNCVFEGNASLGGGGLSVQFTTAEVVNCVFNGNTAGYQHEEGTGGAIHHEGRLLSVVNSSFANNSAGGEGGAGDAFYGQRQTSILTNCIVWNDAETTASDSLVRAGVIRYCDVQGSGASGAGWDAELGVDGGGNLDVDPRWMDARLGAGADGEWRTGDDGVRLSGDSPCIDAGAGVGVPVLDVLGQGRVGSVDMGAYEFVPVKSGVGRWEWGEYF